MLVSSHIDNLGQFLRVNIPLPATAPAPAAPAQQLDSAQQRLNDERVTSINGALNDIEYLFENTRVRKSNGIASVISFATLGLSTAQTATTLNSVEEVNATSTSYTPFDPQFAGSGQSDALPDLNGVYDGSNGDNTLTFKVKRGGTHGEDNLRIEIRDAQGNKLENINVRKNDALDKEYTLKNGLIFTLGAGDLKKNDTFELEVSASVGSVVAPDKAFNGTRADRPNLEYGLEVGAGSFTINGSVIDVFANDSIDSVIDRINNAAIGVTAAFDTATESVQLTQQELGSAPNILLGNDTSGFLAATKLTGPATPGLDRDANTVLSATTPFADVQSGTLRINDVDIAVDVLNDTLNDVIARINDADAGVVASLIHDDQRFLLSAEEEGESIRLEDPDTGLLAALDITPATYKAKASNGFSASRSYEVADLVERIALDLNEIFDDADNLATSDPSLLDLRDRVLSAARDSTSGGIDGDRADSGIGLEFVVDPDAARLAEFVSLERSDLTHALRQRIDLASAFFTGDSRSGTEGLIGSLRNALAGYSSAYGGIDPSAGLVVDLFA